MSTPTENLPLTLAGHAFTVHDRGGGMINVRIALCGAPLIALARTLAKLDGVRVTGGPESGVRERCYLVHCAGFKMVLSAASDEGADFAAAFVSRVPPRPLAVMSDLTTLLERLVIEPPPRRPSIKGSAAARVDETPSGAMPASSSLRRAPLHSAAPLARKTALKRRTPLARGPFKKR